MTLRSKISSNKALAFSDSVWIVGRLALDTSAFCVTASTGVLSRAASAAPRIALNMSFPSLRDSGRVRAWVRSQMRADSVDVARITGFSAAAIYTANG